MRACIAGLVLVAACGRIGFGDQAAGDASAGDGAKRDAQADAPADAPSMWLLVDKSGIDSKTGAASLTSPLATGSTSGELIVVAIHLDPTAQISTLSDNAPGGSSAYTRVAASRATNASLNDALEIWFAPSARGGATTVTATGTTLVYGVITWQFATPAAAVLDTAGQLSAQPTTKLPASPPITTAAAGELVIAATIVSNSASQIHAGNAFTNDLVTNGNGWAHLTDPHAPANSYQAVWDQPNSGTYCSAAVAFAVGP